MNKRFFLFFILFAVFLVDMAEAREAAFTTRRRTRYRYEIIYSAGATNFLGDLGGADRIGTNLLRDLEFRATRPVIGVGLRYKDSPYFALKGTLNMGMLYGNDNLTKEIFRQNRNLNFRSPIIELGGVIEGYFTKEQPGHLYRIKNAKGIRRNDIQAYGFLGVGVSFFNPKGKDQAGAWVALQPLGTEGQGIDPLKKKYSRFTVVFPMGIGVKYKIDRRWSAGMDIGMRKTLTDYLDDVSGNYFDNNRIRTERGDVAAYLADPSLGNTFPQGAADMDDQRGDPKDKDAYMFVTFNANYKFYRRKRTRSKF